MKLILVTAALLVSTAAVALDYSRFHSTDESRNDVVIPWSPFQVIPSRAPQGANPANRMHVPTKSWDHSYGPLPPWPNSAVALDYTTRPTLPVTSPNEVLPSWSLPHLLETLPPVKLRPSGSHLNVPTVPPPAFERDSPPDEWPMARRTSTATSEKRPRFTPGLFSSGGPRAVVPLDAPRVGELGAALRAGGRLPERSLRRRASALRSRCARFVLDCRVIIAAPDTRWPRQQEGVGPPRKQLPRKRLPADLRSLARGHTALSIKVLAGIAQNGQTDAARVAAATALLDRGWGRPPQAHTGENGEGDIRVVIRHIVGGRDVEPPRPLQIDAVPNETYETDGEE